jgi:Recombinase
MIAQGYDIVGDIHGHVEPSVERHRHTLTGLANALNERGIKTGPGSRWHPQTVKRVLEARA